MLAGVFGRSQMVAASLSASQHGKRANCLSTGYQMVAKQLIVRLLGLGSLVVSPLIWFRGCVVCLHEHVGHIIPILVMLPQCQV